MVLINENISSTDFEAVSHIQFLVNYLLLQTTLNLLQVLRSGGTTGDVDRSINCQVVDQLSVILITLVVPAVPNTGGAGKQTFTAAQHAPTTPANLRIRVSRFDSTTMLLLSSASARF